MTDQWCILDDSFPNLLSAFRIAEYNAYLAASPGLTVLSTNPQLPRFKAEYAELYPEFAERVQPASNRTVQGRRFAYLIFLNNAYYSLNGLQAFGVPFAFTLYPGGGFGLGDPESDAKLLKVTSSNLLQGILTTQNVTNAYLAERAPHVPRDLLFGATIHPAYFTSEHQAEAMHRPRYGRGKPVLDICFAAVKYMPDGANKGWPIFAAAIEQLLASDTNIRLHVVGGFSAQDCLSPPPEERVIFHGHALTHALRPLLLTMDAIVSPNEPFKLHAGNFDGFPTGCCIEASLCGAAMVVTDVLGINPVYRDGEDICLIEPSVQALVERVRALAARPDALAAIGEAGRRTTHSALHPDLQIGRRKEFLTAAAARAGVDLGLDG